MSFFDVRRARVRAEFANLYPELTPGVWLSAKKAARMVWRSGQRAGRPVLELGHRVLPDLHFEFRGGRRGRQYLTGMWTPRAAVLTG